MPAGRPPLDELAKRFARATSILGEDEARLALHLYRLLARGAPVDPSDLARDLGLDVDLVAQMVGGWSGVVFDEAGGIEGFWGLTIRDVSSHRFWVFGRRLFTWCAWDTLFLPELLATRARVESLCPVSGASVEIVLDRCQLEWHRPAGVLVSFRDPGSGFDGDVVGSFCRFVHFLASEDEGRAWSERHPGTFTLSLPEALELGRMSNATRFGSLLGGRPR